MPRPCVQFDAPYKRRALEVMPGTWGKSGQAILQPLHWEPRNDPRHSRVGLVRHAWAARRSTRSTRSSPRKRTPSEPLTDQVLP
eukprot:scaffold133845_cov33-Tisochrysis_lutea.AAC.5